MSEFMPPEFSVRVEREAAREVVRLIGELDLSTIEHLQEATEVLNGHGRSVHFDLGGLSFIDSTGLRYFVEILQLAQREGFTLTLTRPRPDVFRVFELTSLDGLLPWSD